MKVVNLTGFTVLFTYIKKTNLSTACEVAVEIANTSCSTASFKSSPVQALVLNTEKYPDRGKSRGLNSTAGTWPTKGHSVCDYGNVGY